MINNILDTFLLKEIELSTSKKLIKKGTLVLYKDDLYYFTLYIKNPKNEIKKLEVPKPFNIDIIKQGKRVEFDYRLSTLSKECDVKLESVNKIPRIKESKYYNTIATLLA
jgi:hypothetical protein